MSDWEEDEIVDPESEEADEPEAEEPDPKLQAAVQAAVAAEREKIETAEKQKFEEYRKDYGRRFDQVHRDARALGMEIDKDGHILPAKQAPEKPKPAETAEAEILFDPYDSPEEATRKMRLLAHQEAQKLAAAEVGPLRAEVEALRKRQTASTLQFSQPLSRAESFLDDVAPWAKGDTLFQEHFQAAMATLPEEALLDEDAINMAAGVALAHTRSAYKQQGKPLPKTKVAPTPEEEAARKAALNRNGLSQSAPSRGGAPPEAATEEEQAVLAEWPASWGPMDVKGLRALERDSTGGAYRAHQKRHHDKQQRTGA